MQGPKQAPVYPRADCVATNRRLFGITQNAGPQTGTCLPSRRLRSPKQAPVWHYTKCRDLNRHLFTLAQASAEAEEVYPGTRPNFPAPAGALLRFEDGIMVAQKALSGEQRGIAAGQRPDKDFGWLFTFASDKGFLE